MESWIIQLPRHLVSITCSDSSTALHLHCGRGLYACRVTAINSTLEGTVVCPAYWAIVYYCRYATFAMLWKTPCQWTLNLYTAYSQPQLIWRALSSVQHVHVQDLNKQEIAPSFLVMDLFLIVCTIYIAIVCLVYEFVIKNGIFCPVHGNTRMDRRSPASSGTSDGRRQNVDNSPQNRPAQTRDYHDLIRRVSCTKLIPRKIECKNIVTKNVFVRRGERIVKIV